MENQEEIWRPIINWEGYYEVSNQGNVRGCPRAIRKSNNQIQNLKGKIVKSHNKRDGYKQLNLLKDGKVYSKTVHRLVAEAFIPNPENKPCINHINGVRYDNRRDNLEWSTVSENNKDAWNRGIKREPGSKSCVKAVIIKDTDGKEIGVIWSRKAAAKLVKGTISGISNAIVYKINYKGYRWDNLK